MKLRFLLPILSLLVCASVLGRDIEGVDVVIAKRPGGQVVGKVHQATGGAFSIPSVPPGTYTVTISFTDATPTQSAGKNFYESRSNTARIAMSPTPLPAGCGEAYAFVDYPYVFSVGGSNIVLPKGSDAREIKRHGNQIEITQQIEITGKTPQAVRGLITRSSQVGPATGATPVGIAPRPVG